MKGHKRFARISNLERKRRLYQRIDDLISRAGIILEEEPVANPMENPQAQAQLAQAQMIAEQNRLQQGAEQHRRAKEMREIFSPHRRKF